MTQAPAPQPVEPKASPLAVTGTLILAAAVLFGLLVAFDHWVMPPSRPQFVHPSAFDVLIDSRLVIGLIRLIALVLALYVIISVVAHIRSRRWVVAFGSATTGESDRTVLQQQLAEAENNYQTLAAEYETVIGLLSQVASMLPDDESGGANP